jgi:hypothetical protein
VEYYTLTPTLQKDQLIEGYQSFIWTERYYIPGDFQIVTKSSFNTRALLAVGTYVTRQDSTYVGLIDTIVDAEDQNGVRLLTVTGKFLEQILEDRAAISALADTTTVPNWVLSGTPRSVIQELFDAICVRCVIDQGDSIPFYTFGTLLPTGNLPEPTDTITVTLQPQSLLSAVAQLCQQYNYGFRFVKDGEKGRIYFEIYVGNDRTTRQSIYNPVVFDPDLENLSQVSLLSSKSGYKNVAYVVAANGAAIVYGPTGSTASKGTDRRVLLISSSNSDAAGLSLDIALQAEGQLALASQQALYAFDGQLPPNSSYIYGRDYNLGDKIEERNQDNMGNEMIVTEQIFASDNTGDTAYPTLTLFNVITPGSWLAWTPGTQKWTEVNASVTWNSLGGG